MNSRLRIRSPSRTKLAGFWASVALDSDLHLPTWARQILLKNGMARDQPLFQNCLSRDSMRLTRLAIATAPALFVILWSTGFIGARFGLPYIEPLTFLAVRMAFVVLIMAALAVLGDVRPPDAAEVGHSLVAGSLVHGLCLGGVFTAISQGVPAGISALIPGLQPIVTSTIANRFMGESVTRVQWIGLVLGLVGVFLVLHDRSIVLAGSPLGWAASFLSLIGITVGTLYQKRYCGGIDWRAGNLIQYIGAASAVRRRRI